MECFALGKHLFSCWVNLFWLNRLYSKYRCEECHNKLGLSSMFHAAGKFRTEVSDTSASEGQVSCAGLVHGPDECHRAGTGGQTVFTAPLSSCTLNPVHTEPMQPVWYMCCLQLLLLLIWDMWCLCHLLLPV